ncbi:MAG: Asp-tRNA(Asn)/Glu-tRNA(Gln) amidotransferase subunit GatC [Dietzia sp.]|uniref:Asp-tRNA(Asn)/Glu-tRNA(Gln) amidotransferase subunit GatC n=1 Tax=Demequina sp. TaxID=2050685 RepID=UPI0019BB542F|nr:Asp-tRNA(Asn)/Glu-tRNA(Gln) amidotransferase subunit GatC [Demequina sp.]MBC7298455.1 Asp-tRNA(Asn)/Glu-tRNA(Gln) amidotransferase subunit GatC [Demequina sp.]MBC7306915.1 Asp-tRNA(Asn)/Glu-tRNA(Gln) amidotransferase subunit GatC [Dietzia sp.]
MSHLSRADVARLAALARIDMNDADLDRLSGQIDAIVDAVALVSEVANQDVPATSHPIPMSNVHRVDEVRPSLAQADALAAAPEAEDGRFRVPRILGEEA